MFVIEVPHFNLDHIYNSGQVPRWIKLKESKYVVMHKDKVLKIEQQRDRFDLNRYRLIMSCTEEDFYNIWFDYFDLRTDYLDLNAKAKKLGGKFKVPANRGSGIHILNQDPFEVYVFTKIIEKVGYIRAFMAINHIAEACGIKHVQSMREAGRITWYEFPTPEMILENFDNLKKMGKINTWLKRLCEAIVNDFYAYSHNGNILYELFAKHNISAFPTYGIEETITKNFGCPAEEFADWYLCDFENKGLIYMYVLHHIMNPPEEVKLYGTN